MLDRCGMLARHGPHHVAQKSTITGLLRSSARRSGLPSSVLTLNEGAVRAAATIGAKKSSASVAVVRRSGVAVGIMALLGDRPALGVIGFACRNCNRKARWRDAALGDLSPS